MITQRQWRLIGSTINEYIYNKCREWYLLRNLPKISVLDGDPLSRADLRAVKINLSRTCIVLSAKVENIQQTFIQ